MCIVVYTNALPFKKKKKKKSRSDDGMNHLGTMAIACQEHNVMYAVCMHDADIMIIECIVSRHITH